MSNKPGFYDDILNGELEKRDFTYNGKQKTTFFRKVSGAERIELLRGQTMQAGGGNEKPTFSIDLADSAERNAKLIAFSNVDGDGKQIFANGAEVKKLPDDLISILYKFASEVNKEEMDEAGKG